MPATLTLLGTGTSAGVPMIGCRCAVCTSEDPRDRRDRPGALVRRTDAGGEESSVLIDTTPDLRHQVLRQGVTRIEGVVYTHNHADHIFGIDDLRRFNAVQGRPIDIFAERRVLDSLARSFPYIFQPHRNVNRSFIPTLTPHEISPLRPFELGGLSWLPLRLLHGRLPVLGYRVGGMAYCTDCSGIPPETWPHLEGLDVLVIDALRYRRHPTHMTVEEALGVIERLRPRRAFLTHIAHDIRHAELEAELPEGVSVGYDGVSVGFALGGGGGAGRLDATHKDEA